MEQNNLAKLSIVIIGATTELGSETTRQLLARGHQVTGILQDKNSTTTVDVKNFVLVEANPKDADELSDVLSTVNADVVLNLLPQIPNTLLHDGHAWKGYDQTLKATTSAVIKAIENSSVKFLVHPSYAFLYGNATDATENTPLSVPSNDPIFQAAIDVENQVINSKIPACVLRMGFLYGPQSSDLKKYVTSFKLRRPYFAGKKDKLTNLLHFEDAAGALVLVAEQKPVGEVFNVVDGTPVSFGDFIDHFALLLGMKKPGHIPLFLAPVARIIIKLQQMELLDLFTIVKNDKIRSFLGFSPHYTSYRSGLEQTLQTWRAKGVKV
ncbi:NAD-dependent epimerase/dehydratase family protein [Nostoc sp. MG11]|uniref:NAD-dependent epimerase/dehydratase family protein n=1 Tax=Nostoc sp. MG11 TaxID=2721166 RepID=UPI0018692DEB|nr:NAD-dependent epimerase/dehydratase family protein [Nostoc sp. MG11]